MYQLNRVVHQDSPVPGQPIWDTLIGIFNPYKVPVDITIRFYDMTGREVPNSPIVFTLNPGCGVANTLIAGNTWATPPQNFAGWATIEFGGLGAPGLPVFACLGGGGHSPYNPVGNWNSGSPEVRLFGASQKSEGPGKRWVFPYAIPYFRDPAMHAGIYEYRSGWSVINKESTDVTLDLTYTVDEYYPNAGQKLTCQVTIPAGQAKAWQLHELFPDLLTMNPRTYVDENGQTRPLLRLDDGKPEYEGSEGSLDIRSTDGTAKNLIMYFENTNEQYNCFACSEMPWIIE
jgi:hypothetical protein